MKHFRLLLISVLVLFTEVAHANFITNGDFEDLSGNFPNGWTPASQATSVSTMFGLSAAQIHGAIDNNFLAAGTGLNNFQLDFAFQTSLAPGANDIQHRIRIRGNSGTGPTNLISLAFDDTGIRSFSSDGWADDLLGLPTILADTTYYVRVIGQDFDLLSRSFILGFSTDGTNYVTAVSTRFHSPTPPLLGFNSIRFERNALAGETLTIDNVSVIESVGVVPEPASIIPFALAAGCAFFLRRKPQVIA